MELEQRRGKEWSWKERREEERSGAGKKEEDKRIIKSDKHLPQSPPLLYMSIFLDDDILLWCLYSYSN